MILAMILRELRENLRWALLGLLLVTAGVSYAFWNTPARPNFFTGVGLLSSSYQMLTTFACPVIGFGLGLMSTLPESRRDRWAFLVHHPVSRTQIFHAKLLSASILYLLATIPPLLIAILYASTPGHFAYPFLLAMTKPTCADLLAGLIYIPAGIIVAIRHAGWIRTRLLPLGAPVICSLLVVSLPYFWAALLAIAIAFPILLLTAWGLFRAGGEWEPIPSPAKPALFCCTAIGLAIVGAIAIGIFLSIATPGSDWTYQSDDIADSGHVYRVTYRAGVPIAVTEPDGSPSPDLAEVQSIKKRISTNTNLQTLYITPPPTWLAYQANRYRESSNYLRPMVAPDQTLWYFLRAQRLVVGFDRISRLPAASAGPAGFLPRPSGPASPFPPGTTISNWNISPVLYSPHGVYILDFDNLQVKQLPGLPPAHPVTDATMQSHGIYTYTMVATGNSVYFYRNSHLLHSFPVSPGTEQFPTANVGPLGNHDDRLAIWAQPAPWESAEDAPPRPSRLTIYDSATGQLISDQSIPPIPTPSYPDPPYASLIPVAAFPPITLATALTIKALLDSHTLAYQLAHLTPLDWTCAAVALAFAILAAGLTWWLARRHAFPPRSRLIWTLTNFLFGLLGLLTMLAIRHWPARLPCHNCHSPRPVTLDLCPSCRTPWTPPPHDNTEILDPL